MQPQMQTSYRPVAESSQASRAEFLLKTYAHVFAALSAFALLEIALFKSGAAEALLRMLGGASWLVVMGAFVLVGWLCTFTAHRVQSLTLQYVALCAYVVMEALVFVPLLFLADANAPGTISSAAYITLAGFAGLTAVAYFTRIDFSFLRAVLIWAGICALIAVVAGAILGFELGTWFSVAMVALAGGSVLYNTSNILLRYPEDRYVAAALELFGSVAMMFWYVLRLLNRRR
jgi:hypothetical protein